MGVQKVSHLLLTQVSSVCGKVLEIPSSHSKLEDCGSGHVLWLSSFSLWNHLFVKTVAILHPQKRRCEVGSLKRGGGGMSVNQVIKTLSPYCIYVCGNIQDSPLVLKIVNYCVYVYI